MTDAPVDLDELERQLHVDVHADDYKCPRCECDVLGENEYESIFCQECAYDVAENVVPALIAELRAARAVSQEASELRAEALTQVQTAMLTDAMRYPENGALHCRWCDGGIRDGHDGRCWYAEQCRRVDFAKALVDTLLKASPPPADEVAGLLADLHDLRVLALDNATTDHRRKSVTVRADRIENHLKGKR